MNTELSQAIDRFPLIPWLEAKFDRVSPGSDYLRVDCPHCGGKRTLSIHRERKFCQCFRCADGGHGGDRWRGSGSLVDLVALVDHLTRRDAIRQIIEEGGRGDLPFERRPAEIAQEAAPRLPDGCLPMNRIPATHASRAKLAQRGLDHMAEWIFVATERPLINRWILPVWWDGELVGYEGKSFVGGKPKSRFPDWFRSGDYLYTTHEWDWSWDLCILTESVFDAETLGKNAVGIFGSALRDGQCNRLAELRKRGIRRLVWFLDWDAWTKQRRAILRKTILLFENLVAHPPEGSDPNQLGRKQAWDLVWAATPVHSSLDLLRN